MSQAKAQLNQNQVNLDHTIIEAPIDGIITQRSVDVGQTVNAGMQAPTLFIIAADLTKMQVNASIDEADIGSIRPGQRVTFHVDAYPAETFQGTVEQIRLQTLVVQNVTTYATMLNVPNQDLRLKPGMTANLREGRGGEAQTNVLRIPNTAARFRPTTDMFAAFNQPVRQRRRVAGVADGEVEGCRPGRRRECRPECRPGCRAECRTGCWPGRRPGQAWPGICTQRVRTSGFGLRPDQLRPERCLARRPVRAAAVGSARKTFSGVAAAGGGRGADRRQAQDDRRAQQIERFKSMSPDEQTQFIARMKDRGQDTAAFEALVRTHGRAGGRLHGSSRDDTPRYGGPQSGETIDSLFKPLPVAQSTARAWIFVDRQLKPVNIRLGITDGTYTEVVGGELQQKSHGSRDGHHRHRQHSTAGWRCWQRQPAPRTAAKPGGGGPGGFGGGGRGR